MEEWPNFGEVSPDYRDISKEEKAFNSYVTEPISNAESDNDLAISTFHDSDLSMIWVMVILLRQH